MKSLKVDLCVPLPKDSGSDGGMGEGKEKESSSLLSSSIFVKLWQNKNVKERKEESFFPVGMLIFAGTSAQSVRCEPGTSQEFRIESVKVGVGVGQDRHLRFKMQIP